MFSLSTVTFCEFHYDDFTVMSIINALYGALPSHTDGWTDLIIGHSANVKHTDSLTYNQWTEKSILQDQQYIGVIKFCSRLRKCY